MSILRMNCTKRARATALAALCTAVSICPAAQEETSPSVNADVLKLEPMTVTASRFETDASTIAASVSLIDLSTIADTAATNVADLLGDLGVMLRSFTGNPTQSTIDMRGYGESGNLNVLVLIDGRRVNAPDMSGINWLNMPLVGVDKIEVLRGSQSAMYGNNAGGGVIKVSTSVPDGVGGSAMAGYGSWQSWVFRATAWSPVTKNIRQRTEVGYISSDGYRDNSGYRTRSVSTNFEGHSGTLKWTANAGYDDNTFQYPGCITDDLYEEDPTASSYAPYEKDYQGESNSVWGGGSADWKNDALDVHADLNGTRRNLSWDMGSGSSAESTLDTITFSPRVRHEWDNGFSLIAGADGEFDYMFLERFAELTHSTVISHARLRRLTGGVYANASWTSKGERPFTVDFTSRAQRNSLKADIIYDDNSYDDSFDSKSHSDSALSLGTTWTAAKNFRVWARGDRFFRYPAIDEVASYQGYPMKEPFNSDLVSEHGWGCEIGADWALPHLMLKSSVYAQDVDGMIVYDYIENLNRNFADATRMGAEISAKFTYGDWSTGAFCTIMRVRYTSGTYEDSELYLVPHNQANGYIEWKHSRFSLRATVRYTGACWEGNDYDNVYDRMPSYTVFDFVARVRLMKELYAYAAVGNLFDKKYATLRYSGCWYPADARSFRGGFQVRF